MEIEEVAKQELINAILKTLITPNVKEEKHSDYWRCTTKGINKQECCWLGFLISYQIKIYSAIFITSSMSETKWKANPFM